MPSLVPSEAQLQALVVQLAELRRWRCYHTFDSRKSAGGFPDLVLVRPGDRAIFAELKKQGERPRPDQVVWLDALASTGQEVYLWTMADVDRGEVGRILGRRWTLVPHGEHVMSGDSPLHGPRLVDGAASADTTTVSIAPRSIWIAGHGRRDA